VVATHHRHGCHVVAAVAVALASSWSGPARAAASYAFAFAAPTGSGCPDAAAVARDVAAHLHDATRATGARVDLRIRAATSGFAGELVVTDRGGNQGRRRIDADSCDELAHALAFLAGLALELGGRLEGPATDVFAPTVAAAPTEGFELGGAWIAAVAAAGVRGGVTDGARPDGEIGVEWQARRSGWLAPTVRAGVAMSQGRAAGADWRAGFLLASSRLDACPVRLQVTRWEWRPCVGAELGALRVESDAAAGAGRATRLWAAVDGSLRTRWWTTPRAFVDVEVGAMLPLAPDASVIAGGQVARVAPPVTVRAVIAGGVRF
jgi:hypothetical protein